MTKLLNVVTGEYVSFISSMEYDKIHKTPINTKVIVFEDSHEYSYRGTTAEEYIKVLVKNSEDYTFESFEIIYD